MKIGKKKSQNDAGADKAPKKVKAAKAPPQEERQRNTRFVHEPPAKGVKAFDKAMAAMADIDAAKERFQELLAEVPAAFGREGGFSFIHPETGEFKTIMPRTYGDRVVWFTREAPQFKPGASRGGRPAGSKNKKTLEKEARQKAPKEPTKRPAKKKLKKGGNKAAE